MISYFANYEVGYFALGFATFKQPWKTNSLLFLTPFGLLTTLVLHKDV
jgi:hypothetical protein